MMFRSRKLLIIVTIAMTVGLFTSIKSGSSNHQTINLSYAQSRTSTPTGSSTATTAIDTFEINGEISSLVLGMPSNTRTVDMTSVQKFILSGNWSIDVSQGKLSNFKVKFYTGPVNRADNHTHQLSNFRINSNTPIQLKPDKSLSLSGILDVGTNGNKAWNNVNATVDISSGRTITIWLDDNDTQRHFMGQSMELLKD